MKYKKANDMIKILEASYCLRAFKHLQIYNKHFKNEIKAKNILKLIKSR